jgi:hypothetical protein
MTTPKTAADILADVGRSLYGEEWQARLAAELGIKPTMLRDWRRGKSKAFGPKHGVFGDLVALAEEEAEEAARRATETAKARDALKAWIKANS